MNRVDMLKLFGLDDRPEPAAVTAPVEVRPASGTAPPPTHALDVDLWSVRRGREFLDGEFADSLKQLDLGDTPDARAAAGADLFAAAFEPEPTLNESCADAVRHEYLSHLLTQDDYQSLHTMTTLDEATSELAAAKFAQGLADLRLARKAREAADRKPAKPGQPGGKKPADAETEALDREVEAMAAAAGAVAAATAEVEAATDAAAACGMGGGGGLDGRIPARAVGDLYRRVRNSPHLRRICELAGRFRRLAQGKQKNRVSHGYDDTVGVTLGGDPGRLVGSELALLGIDGLDDELALRLVENRAVVRELAGVEPVGKGPIVVTVDESGSMAGERVYTAKALALALAWVARSQRRWCCLVGFSGGTQGTFCVLPPGRWDESALCDWLEHFYNGGTDLDVPIEVLPARWDALVRAGMTRGKSDIVMLTDARVNLKKDMEESFNAFKKRESVRLIAMVIQNRPGDLSRIADEVYEVSTIGTESEAVGRVVSI